MDTHTTCMRLALVENQSESVVSASWPHEAIEASRRVARPDTETQGAAHKMHHISWLVMTNVGKLCEHGN